MIIAMYGVLETEEANASQAYKAYESTSYQVAKKFAFYHRLLQTTSDSRPILV